MSLSLNVKNQITQLLTTTVREKLKLYQPETVHMPFHHNLLGRDRYAMFSFIQSMNTTFGMSLWEQVAEILATNAGNYAKRQYKLLGEINEETELAINIILLNLRKGEIIPNKNYEIEWIRKNIKEGQAKIDPDSTVDLFVRIKDEENYFDITSAKPNIKEFVALKRKLLRWTALRLSQDRKIKVFTRLAIPYNPYYPQPYERWTLSGLYDLKNKEVLVGEDFWNYIASDKIYEELLDIFKEVGEELREDIDNRFKEFRD